MQTHQEIVDTLSMLFLIWGVEMKLCRLAKAFKMNAKISLLY